MTLETLRALCLGFPEAAEDIKWGQDLVFSVRKKMFCVVNTEPPHQLSFKATAEHFAELIERPGMRPAPYLARAMWVQQEQLGEALDDREAERLIGEAYELVRAKLPKRKAAKPGRGVRKTAGKRPAAKRRVSAARRSRAVPAPARRRRR